MLQQGAVSKDSIWDRMSFEVPRKEVLGEMSDTLRGVIACGGKLTTSWHTQLL